MNAGTWTAIAVGLFSLIGAVVAAILSYRASKATAHADEMVAVLNSYDELVRNHREELDRLRIEVDRVARRKDEEVSEYENRLTHLRSDLRESEIRCRDCNEQYGDLLANFVALKAIVVDEVARTAAEVIADGDPATTTNDLRNFLTDLPKHDGDRRRDDPKETP